MDYPKIEKHDCTDGPEKDGIGTHEVQEGARRGEDLPGDESPANEGAEELTTADIDDSWHESHQVISCGE